MFYEKLFVGIDVSKYKHDIAFMNADKKLLGQVLTVSESCPGFQQLLTKLQHLKEKYQTKIFYIGMEATGDYWKNLYHFLKSQSEVLSVTVINAFQTRHFAQSELRRAKTDPIDAKDIALFMLQKQPRATAEQTILFDTIKDIDRQIHYYGKQRTRLLNKLRVELTKVAPELEQAKTNLNSRQLLTVLKTFPTAESIVQAPETALCSLRYGSRNYHLPAKFVKELKMLCENSIGYKKGVGSGYVVQSLIRQILDNLNEVAISKSQISELYQQISPSESILASIPSLSKENAIALEAYIGDVTRFPNAKKLVAYFGMNPTVNCSGKTKRASRLQKRGCALVRKKLFLAVLSMIRHRADPIYSYYRRLVDSGKPKLVAICAAMRKLLVIMYAMLKNQKPFDAKKNEKS